MSYQNQQGYQNVPHSDQQQQSQQQMNNVGTAIPMSAADSTNSNPGNYQQQYGIQPQNQNQNHQQQHQHQSSSAYQMPSYHDHGGTVQNGNGNNGNGSSNVYNTNLPNIDMNFGNYGPNVGSLDWSQYTRQSRRNRTLLVLAVGLFILFVIAHPAGQQHPTATNGNGNGNSNVSDVYDATTETQHKGIAGDGHHNNNDAAPAVNSAPVISSEDEVIGTKPGQDVGMEIAPAPANQPKITYLLTFPMSGTTYTILLVSRTTNTTVATNYAVNAYTDKDGNHVPVYPPPAAEAEAATVASKEVDGDVLGSPFWYSTYGYSTKPTHNVLTLSHCAGHCMHPCTPDNYIQTEASFEEACRTIIDHGADGNYFTSVTPKADISKVIHLIRDPFSNIVSRFHAYLHEEGAKAKHELLSNIHPNSPEGFKAWCHEIDNDANLMELEQKSSFIPLEIKEFMEQGGIPCHSEFYKYVSWHNHVEEMAWNEDYPILEVYYEDYTTKEQEQQQAIKMAEFLEEPIVDINHVLPTFLVVRYYRDYYTEEERMRAERFIKALALRKTWGLLERYFEEGEKEEKNAKQEQEEGVDGEA